MANGDGGILIGGLKGRVMEPPHFSEENLVPQAFRRYCLCDTGRAGFRRAGKIISYLRFYFCFASSGIIGGGGRARFSANRGSFGAVDRYHRNIIKYLHSEQLYQCNIKLPSIIPIQNKLYLQIYHSFYTRVRNYSSIT